ncbi:membrane-bound acid phosphatase 1 precursor [Trypanosoma equiperdum]|uniref:Membrane-bound acid phosphatase 2 n=2 Tax=Trypanozoon TaxID=39700 RepID=Q38AP9_TRYB2|nr:membrane-bound acid phosphatase 2 [Trypanosoma brucei brucei TREU927]EAN78121.1 membrane-bound acid phosphatase 2 [Trypanosoma brucei brucei TREU927]SCU68799.1 membrane-bound acid phosphatase 1 precursor [Trypanosoma equiperdum]
MPYACLHGGSLCLLISLLSCLGAQAVQTLHLVQLVHRHGARSPKVKHNQSQICGEVPCGYLNAAGKMMLVNAGEFLRNHYNSNASEPFFPEESYNSCVTYSRSTDVPRTLQSAGCLLRGMFPNASEFFPAIHTADVSTDWLLRYDVIPQAYAFSHLDEHWWRNVCNPKLDTLIDTNTLLSVSREVFSEGFCADPQNRCHCAATLFDIGVAMQSDGRIDKHPLLRENLGRLRDIKFFEDSHRFVYNASDRTHAKMGSLGQHLAQEILKNAENHMNGLTSYKLYHYSAHDTTIAPLAATLGDSTTTGITPPYGQLYAFELLYDHEVKGYIIRIRRGAPGQKPEEGYAFSWGEFQMKCMNENHTVYTAEDNKCPYHDFRRFVKSTKPHDPAGLCYLNRRYRELFHCPGNVGKPPNKQCKVFRRVCPAWSCEEGYTLNSVTLECVCSSRKCMENRDLSISTDTLGRNLFTIFIFVLLALLIPIFSVFVCIGKKLRARTRRTRAKG